MSLHLLLALGLLCSCHAVRPIDTAIAPQKDQKPLNAPWFCHDIDCPAYNVSQVVGTEIELRSYPAGLWISTNVSGVSYTKATSTGFLRLFEYISGANEHGTKIAMTAPVRNRLVPGPGPFCEDFFTISFFMPFEYQNGTQQPPAPNRDTVFVDPSPAASYWVYSYAGYTSESKIVEKAADMLEQLDAVGASYDASYYYSAGYDAPFRILNRHNELWVPATATTDSK
eukprot:CAMPEP_0119102292 /NCGR_PEP_ID=MMETSP1180-20130426/1079_1 /TAXON_ID=3052 ORGANISM="Chlamydomonas cf sp, Strain CCMP681" /NCGR_SAMPLE_ID=MMETSP1180 /ASSEMBLY_ACC=CAM_ASM_000741 /LENGTH=226 /DNA_ID=CAMNT_0007086547 /DNA_START=24 /DNA_END=704 /DNA_ORIENTATION=-